MKFKFNRDYTDLKLDRDIKAEEVVEMTQTRADEIVESIHKQASENPLYVDYKDFAFEKVAEPKKTSAKE